MILVNVTVKTNYLKKGCVRIVRGVMSYGGFCSRGILSRGIGGGYCSGLLVGDCVRGNYRITILRFCVRHKLA